MKRTIDKQTKLSVISIFLCLSIIGFCYYSYFFVENGYLPSPFVFDKTNTFMDLFNTMYWAYDDGRYTEWGSVYPPLVFITLKLINTLFFGSVYAYAEAMREDSIYVVIGFILIFLTIPAFVLKIKSWGSFSLNEKILIYFAIILSSPMLFALERGNVIVFIPIILALVLSKIGFFRASSIAILINIKPYFVLLLLYYVSRRNWRGLLSCIVLSSFIFFITGLALDENFYIFLKNLITFSQEERLFSVREVMAMPSSVSAFSYILKHIDVFHIAVEHLGSNIASIVIEFIEVAKWAAVSFAMIVIFTKSHLARDAEIFCLLTILISNIGIWVGGYSLIFYFALIPTLINMQQKKIYLYFLLMFVMPIDFISLKDSFVGVQFSYLANSLQNIHWTLGVGSILRPAVNILFLLVISYELYIRNEKRVNG